jgi:hypothetical protein
MVISDFRFGHNSSMPEAMMYVYHNSIPRCFINEKNQNWCGIEIGAEFIVVHESLHKVINSLEGAKASKGLDKWCKKREYKGLHITGVCFTDDEVIDLNLVDWM